MTNLPEYIVFDIETTGLSPEKDAIIEVSALKVCSGEVTDEFSTLVNPRVHIPSRATDITGITDDMVSSAPAVDVVLREFIAFIGALPLVGQNIFRFDMKFIQRDASLYLGVTLSNTVVDTLFMAKRLLPSLSSTSLESLASHYGVSYEGAHRALADCKINLEVYKHLLVEARNPSAEALAVPFCPRCGNVLKKRDGKFGEFWGCGSYPDCKYTRNIKQP